MPTPTTLSFSLLKISPLPLQNEHPQAMLYFAIVLAALICVSYITLIIQDRRRKTRNLSIELRDWKQNAQRTRSKLLNDQLNTHFLFNSLASLPALIDEDKQQAIRFAGNLAAVYRYVLQFNEKELVSLKEESSFLMSYFDLIRSRFGMAIELTNNIPDSLLHRKLPPLTLQLLVENAVKHNSALPERPLRILITTESDKLIVENNLQPKTTKAPSANMGLQHIREKYRLLNKCGVYVQHSEKAFKVTIPLI